MCQGHHGGHSSPGSPLLELAVNKEVTPGGRSLNRPQVENLFWIEGGLRGGVGKRTARGAWIWREHAPSNG